MMDSNKDEAYRCIEIGLTAFRAGNLQKAEKFTRKAAQLFPTNEAKELLAEIESKLSEPKPSSDGVRQRTTGAPKTAQNTTTTTTQTTADYTKDQKELCEKVKRCKDFYEVLGITNEATDSEIKRAYKKLALQLHPDKNHAPGASEAFKILGNAAGTLTDAEKRKKYDLYGHEAATNTSRQYHTNHDHEHVFRGAGNGYESEFTAEELFHMFFGNGFPRTRQNAASHSHNSTRRGSTQNQYYQQGTQQQPSLAFGLILVLVLVSMLASFFTSDPIYSLSQTAKYPVQRRTAHLNIPYYVREQFHREFQGTMARLENNVEEEYIMVMKQNCYRERNYRELMIARARNFGTLKQLEEARALKVTSCENLARIGLTRFMPN